MKRRVIYLSLLPVIICITLIHLAVRPAMAEGVVSYDSSKFKPISMIETLPLFDVIDERQSKQVLFNIKRDVIPVDKYFRDGLQDSITQSSSVIRDDGRKLQFVIKDFRVIYENFRNIKPSGDNVTSTIAVDVLISDQGTQVERGNYKSTHNIDVERSRGPIETYYIQRVIDYNFNKILKKIFGDKSFIDAVKK